MFLTDNNVPFNELDIYFYCNKTRKIVDHMPTRCKICQVMINSQTQSIFKCNHLLLCNEYNIAIGNNKLCGHSVNQIFANKYVEIRVYTTYKQT